MKTNGILNYCMRSIVRSKSAISQFINPSFVSPAAAYGFTGKAKNSNFDLLKKYWSNPKPLLRPF